MAEKETVIVTGGAGFVGSCLITRLLPKYRVISLDNYFAGSESNHIEGVEYVKGHTKDIEKLLGHEHPVIIFHLGEYSRVEISLTEPAIVWDLNVAGTFGVLEYWRARGCKLVYAGSSTKFADGGLGRDQSPYAFTKATNTELVRNYARWYGLPYAITYFYNVYGPGERTGRYGTVVEIFRERFLAGEPLLVRAPGTQRRIFTHIDDIIDGLLLVAQKGQGDEFGLGSEDELSILELAELFGAPIEMLPEVPGNRMQSSLDATKSHAIGWRAKRSIREYIESIKKEKK